MHRECSKISEPVKLQFQTAYCSFAVFSTVNSEKHVHKLAVHRLPQDLQELSFEEVIAWKLFVPHPMGVMLARGQALAGPSTATAVGVVQHKC
jgi:hypothetical protein